MHASAADEVSMEQHNQNDWENVGRCYLLAPTEDSSITAGATDSPRTPLASCQAPLEVGGHRGSKAAGLKYWHVRIT